ncbi:MAG: CPBP family intramembrane metalloprotease [Actinobacteria bacterium]|nr:CPBP family intramembrane metalloprotease [Actinomycetota bacterium]
MFPLMVAGQMVSSPLLEEFGWRGFALPRLQQRYTAPYA